MGIEHLLRPNVSTVSESASLSEAATILASADVSCLAVADDQKLVGLITERDMTRSVADRADPGSARVANYMASVLVTVDVSEAMETVTQVMFDLGVRHLPVTKGGRVVGIISVRDLLGHDEPVESSVEPRSN